MTTTTFVGKWVNNFKCDFFQVLIGLLGFVALAMCAEESSQKVQQQDQKTEEDHLSLKRDVTDDYGSEEPYEPSAGGAAEAYAPSAAAEAYAPAPATAYAAAPAPAYIATAPATAYAAPTAYAAAAPVGIAAAPSAIGYQPAAYPA